jgi:FolB domain-containing protein
MDEIFITDLQAHCIIGVHEWERNQPQNILVNIRMFTDTSQAARTDNISDCIDYGEMTRNIESFISKSSRYTVEALAEDIACLCLKHPSVKKIMVRVEKPGVVKDASSVGVQIER